MGAATKLMVGVLVEEGFTTVEAECIGSGLAATFGDDGLTDLLVGGGDESALEYAAADQVVACLTPERIEVFGGPDTPDSDALVYGTLVCADGAGDIRSEFSGWEPSIPVATGDIAALDLELDDGSLTVTLEMQAEQVPAGGPGDTPLVVRMYLVTKDEAGPVAYDVELMRSNNGLDAPGPIVITTVDGETGDYIDAVTYENVLTGPGIITATIPASAVEEVVADDFWVEVRTEWGPDHPITSQEPSEWMIDSACNGPQLVAVSGTAPTITKTEATWAPKTVDELTERQVLVDAGFGLGLPAGWYEQVWMQAADSGGEVEAGEGVRMSGLDGSTRSGIMIDVKAKVRSYDHVVVAVSGAVLEQSLAGTGWNGREAPLALFVTYVDVDGTRHVGLSEDPASPTNMFYRGFTALPEPDMVNGVAVELGEPFIFQFDLMGLDPRPARILSIGIDGGGWAPRVGEVYEIVLAAGG
jgi:hypothetical protein